MTAWMQVKKKSLLSAISAILSLLKRGSLNYSWCVMRHKEVVYIMLMRIMSEI
jgi:hypothetical protein